MMPETAPLSAAEYAATRAMLEWQIELGADEAMLDAPISRYAPVEAAPEAAPEVAPKAPAAEALAAPVPVDPVAEATALAAAAPDLAALAEAMAGFERCELKRGARNFVFADGNPAARVLILGEAPGREEDLEGRPFVGPAGQLLDRMLAAIGLSRNTPDAAAAVYITNVLPWRPPANRDPEPEEIAMFRPFVARHVELVSPDLVVLMGNPACLAGLGQRGILRLRGRWAEAFGRPALPMTHPAYLLRNPAAKREAWADLLALRARLDG
ncbi:MAG: uracil-DNA glycosylase [Phaeovulum sp.]|uniref:uracil-DNA glycosylase n=1 Tax=Phaeovulum sp. TaxID=2934796 RepID=UPI002733F4B5|nr:uracil-DNA glycosylase [Phaeovulum sp.]MDP3862423.1 uracil-DNA glycosylase [Phaeovulum sp.]